MLRTGRPGPSAAQKQEFWMRWKNGQSLSDIGRSLGKHAGLIFGVLSATRGIAPQSRTRSVRSLRSDEREEISRGLAAGRSLDAATDRRPRLVARSVATTGAGIIAPLPLISVLSVVTRNDQIAHTIHLRPVRDEDQIDAIDSRSRR